MARPLPEPVTGAEEYLAAIHDRLAEILGRLPAPAEQARPGQVELREPEPPKPPAPAPASTKRTPNRQAGRKPAGRKNT